MTKFPDLFAALVAPFQDGEVKERAAQGGRKYKYITSRTVMNRLDSILGPENWWDSYMVGDKSVVCALTIRLPDGSTVTKCDAGGYAGLSDEGDDVKSGHSDAFKRAAVKFGVGRYLYGDGVPSYPQRAPDAVAVSQSSEPSKPSSAAPAANRHVAALRVWFQSWLALVRSKWIATKKQFPALTDAPGTEDLPLLPLDILHALGTWACVKGYLAEMPASNDASDYYSRLAPVYATAPHELEETAWGLVRQHVEAIKSQLDGGQQS